MTEEAAVYRKIEVANHESIWNCTYGMKMKGARTGVDISEPELCHNIFTQAASRTSQAERFID